MCPNFRDVLDTVEMANGQESGSARIESHVTSLAACLFYVEPKIIFDRRLLSSKVVLSALLDLVVSRAESQDLQLLHSISQSQ